MNHPSLGAITDSKSPGGGYEARFDFNGSSLKIQIDPEDRTLDEAVEFAASVVKNISKLEREAMNVIVRDLQPMYNNGWNEYDETQEDGTTKTVRNPKLSETEFEKQFSLESIATAGNECIEFWFQNSNLFWGHGTYVSCLFGLDLSDAQAELFG